MAGEKNRQDSPEMAEAVRIVNEIAGLLTANRHEEAEQRCLAFLRGSPGAAEVLHYLGLSKGQQERNEDAEALLRSATLLQPANPVFHHNLGTTISKVGKLAEAESHFRESIRLKADYFEAYQHLTSIKRFEAGDPLLGQVERLLKGADLSARDLCYLHFAAGKVLDDTGRYDEAFAHYRAGNDARESDYRPEAHSARVDEVIEIFTSGWFEGLAGAGSPSRQPVFVVGMPRSGTTLVEQMVASHPEVFGAGELPDIHAISTTIPGHFREATTYPLCMRSAPAELINGFAAAYLKRINALAAGEARIVDKCPNNFLQLGLIGAMFPHAAIIHTRRHPLDICLSCYFQHFTSQEFAFDFEHIANYFSEYMRIMAHWRDALPLPMLEVRYDQLVRAPEQGARRIIDHCGLEWDENCLSFHSSSRPVKTASRWQVRQPVYTDSVMRWKRYDKHLGPLRERLAPFIADWEAGV